MKLDLQPINILTSRHGVVTAMKNIKILVKQGCVHFFPPPPNPPTTAENISPKYP
jgi:hypothetical protein